jgi:hypothetical protein
VKTVILVGTSHQYQFGETVAGHAFGQFLVFTCTSYRVRAIAEEMSEEAVERRGAVGTVGKHCADGLCLAYRYCDPGTAKRAELGVRDENIIRSEGSIEGWPPERIEQEVRASHAIRETYWFEELLKLDVWPVLFTCGANHVEPLQSMLKLGGVVTVVASADWAP